MSVNFWAFALGKHAKDNGKHRRRWVCIALLGAMVIPLSGCTAFTGMHNSWTYNNFWNERMLRGKNSVAARKAWSARSHCYANQKYVKDFARGFRAGYMDVADGGSGCTPTFPPREYWGWRYQSCEGQAKVAAWFSGFPHGAKAAEQDGVGNWSQIQTSASVQNQYAEHGLLNPEYSGMYPIPQSAVPNPYTGQVGKHEIGAPELNPGEIIVEDMTNSLIPVVPQAK